MLKLVVLNRSLRLVGDEANCLSGNPRSDPRRICPAGSDDLRLNKRASTAMDCQAACRGRNPQLRDEAPAPTRIPIGAGEL